MRHSLVGRDTVPKFICFAYDQIENSKGTPRARVRMWSIGIEPSPHLCILVGWTSSSRSAIQKPVCMAATLSFRVRFGPVASLTRRLTTMTTSRPPRRRRRRLRPRRRRRRHRRLRRTRTSTLHTVATLTFVVERASCTPSSRRPASLSTCGPKRRCFHSTTAGGAPRTPPEHTAARLTRHVRIRRRRCYRLTVNGTFVTEAHLVAHTGREWAQWANFSYWASELEENNWGWRNVNGTCDGFYIQLGRGGYKKCGALTIKVNMATASFSCRGWTVQVSGRPVYNRIAGPHHRLDIGFAAEGSQSMRDLPHGIVGQSFSSMEPRGGKLDVYPEEGEYTTSAMAEGAIDGSAASYEVSSPFATAFAFSRFDAPVPVEQLPSSGAATASVDGCVDEYDDPAAALERPWPDFLSCAEEVAECSKHPSLQQHCAKTCGACGTPSQGQQLSAAARE